MKLLTLTNLSTDQLVGMNGNQMALLAWWEFAAVAGLIILARVFLPVYYHYQCTTTTELLEMRYNNKHIRALIGLLFFLGSSLIFMPAVIYTGSLFMINTENQGRAFSFDTLPAELISGAKVYKSPLASMQEGGIGSTVEITTARPFAFDGFKAVASVKGMYEDISEETTPQMSGLITNTFMDGKLGVLAAASFQQRKLQTNMLETRYWRPEVSLTNRSELDNPDYADNAQFNGVYIPQNFDQNHHDSGSPHRFRQAG